MLLSWLAERLNGICNRLLQCRVTRLLQGQMMNLIRGEMVKKCLISGAEPSHKFHEQQDKVQMLLGGKPLTDLVAGMPSWWSAECCRKFLSNTRGRGPMPGQKC